VHFARRPNSPHSCRPECSQRPQKPVLNPDVVTRTAAPDRAAGLRPKAYSHAAKTTERAAHEWHGECRCPRRRAPMKRPVSVAPPQDAATRITSKSPPDEVSMPSCRPNGGDVVCAVPPSEKRARRYRAVARCSRNHHTPEETHHTPRRIPRQKPGARQRMSIQTSDRGSWRNQNISLTRLR